MTVKELIAKLGTMPPDAVVVFRMCSENVGLDEEEVTLEKMIERNGTYMRYNAKYWDKQDGDPKIIDVCRFPGN